MPSNHTAIIWAYSLSIEHNDDRYDITISEEWYIIFVLQRDHINFLPYHLFGACLYFILRVTFVTARLVRHRIAGGSGKYMELG